MSAYWADRGPGDWHLTPARDARAIVEAVASLSEVFRRMVTGLGPAFDNLFAMVYEVACSLYKEEFGRLPGSERTSRLRKKRRTMVLRWYAAYFFEGL